MMLAATFVSASTLSYSLVIAGFILVVLPCYFFYVKEIRPISRVQETVGRNAEMIDAVQETAMSMTELTLELQALAFKHADAVASTIEVVRPQIRAIPMVGQIADHPMLVSTEGLAKTIVGITQNIKDVVSDVQTALINSDPRGLKKYLRELEKLNNQVRSLLAQGASTPEQT
jgi:hypothetical protein